MLNYLMIASCYGAGCMLSYRLGVKKGINFGIRSTVKVVSKLADKSENQILDLMIAYRKTLKAKSK